MCDISKKTSLKQKTVYKVVFKDNKGDYYSIFTYQPIIKGSVVNDIDEMLKMCYHVLHDTHATFDFHSNLYNPNMRGRVSGFALKKDAFDYVKYSDGYIDVAKSKGYVVVLRLVLNGSILQGTTLHSGLFYDDHITYAGSVIKSFKEIQS